MKEPARQIDFNSPEAATLKTVSGWVSRHGRFYGDDERTARYDGCTHRPCLDCGKTIDRSRTKCVACCEVMAQKTYDARERRPYAGGYVYSEVLNRFFSDEESLRDEIGDGGDQESIDGMRLIICDPVYLHEIDDDYFFDELPEDMQLRDVADDVAQAIEQVNQLIRQRRKNGQAVSWQPGRYAVDTASLKK